jgi:hypothetical protein
MSQTQTETTLQTEVVEMTPRVSIFLRKLKDKLDDRRSIDGIVNDLVRNAINVKAKAEARKILSGVGDKQRKLERLGVTPENITATVATMIKRADALFALAEELEAE